MRKEWSKITKNEDRMSKEWPKNGNELDRMTIEWSMNYQRIIKEYPKELENNYLFMT